MCLIIRERTINNSNSKNIYHDYIRIDEKVITLQLIQNKNYYDTYSHVL